MRKVILGLAVSLDGFIEGPNGEYDWCFTDQDYGLSEFFKRIDTAFIGRKSHEVLLANKDAEPDWMPKVKEYVFSNTVVGLDEGITVISGDFESAVKGIKNQEGKDIWLFGGAALTTSLMNVGLVDELWLSIHPILLGAGKPLFQNINGRVQLELLESKTYDTGLVSVKYALKPKAEK
ncbi:dihydrofolate reductase family protein [Polluticoccus soli]|uniref:dihydrofolate reductase family protein n=1 Tax=Polluticoccus soli TaxID=3034150 RepID=UPI0023E2C308|nr:dihydrofolate reductase family protein [Flavipsychrobacter sp. JY13-12]